MEEVSDKILKIFDIMKESVIINSPEDTETVERVSKIKNYIQNFDNPNQVEDYNNFELTEDNN